MRRQAALVIMLGMMRRCSVSGFSGVVGKLQRSCRMHMSMEASPLGRGKEIFSLAPMMEYTDRHMRFMLRLMSR
jgi:hypothetical protein